MVSVTVQVLHKRVQNRRVTFTRRATPAAPGAPYAQDRGHMSLAERLRVAATSAPGGPSWLCVGLDPLPERTAPENILEFNTRVIDATADFVCAYKPQSAFYEVAGLEGWKALTETISYIRERAPHAFVIWDAKRGDVEHVARAYADVAFRQLNADAVTVNPYLGAESVEPFLTRPDRYAIVCTHTSNLGASEIQDLPICSDAGSTPFYLKVADLARQWGQARQNAGLVVGATYPRQLAQVRERCTEMPILLPGVGAQGGALADSIEQGLDPSGGGLLVSASRSVIYAGGEVPGLSPTKWDEAVRAEALRLRDAIQDAIDAATEHMPRAASSLELAHA